MSKIRPPRATLIDREANSGPDVLPAHVRPASTICAPAAFAADRYSKFKFHRKSTRRNASAPSGVYGLFTISWIQVGEGGDSHARPLQLLDGHDNLCFGRCVASGFAFEAFASDHREGRSRELAA